MTALAAAMMAAALALVPAAAHADDVTWTVRTASTGQGAERTSFSYTVNPGDTAQDALVVANHGTAPLELRVYAADGFTTDSGQFDLVVGGARSVAVGAWVHAGTDTVSVPAGGQVQVPFTLSVPRNATPGDYAGGIVTSLAQPEQSSGVTVDRRLGIRIGLRVSGALTPRMAVEDVEVAGTSGLNPFAGGDAVVSYTIHNTGNTALTSRQAASVSGPFGMLRTDAAAMDAPPALLPGEKWRVRVTVPNAPALFGIFAEATVSPVVLDPSGSKTPLPPVVGTGAGWAVPWAAVGLVLLVAAVVLGALWLRRRGRARRQAQEDTRVAEAVEQALRTERDAREPLSR